MAALAVQAFRSQTYQNKRLLIWDTSGVRPFAYSWDLPDNEHVTEDVAEFTIGELRNRANGWEYGKERPDIFIHWDDDDWSHPNRIAEQVALLQASGKQGVGYRDMLFWREVSDPYIGHQAWLYSNADPRYCLGTSLCYWREVWEKRPFKAISRGEDLEFQRDLDRLGVSTFRLPRAIPGDENPERRPMMIASIHSGNHVEYQLTTHNWKRVPEFDSYCRERMAL